MNDQLDSTDALDPAVIIAAGTELLGYDYDTAKSKLKDLYENSNWLDPEVAGQNLSEVSNNLNRIHGVKPEVKLDSDVAALAPKLLDPKLTEDEKLDAIESWRENTKSALYSSKSADKLFGGFETEKLIDSYAREWRRDITAKDVSRPLDMAVRGMEAALSPLAGVTDLAFDTEIQQALRDKAADYENPAYDESISSIVAGGVGSVGGFAAAALNPYTAWGYLGAMLVDQGKTVYDTALQETGSHESAREALKSSLPGITLGTVADRLVGGSLGAVLKGQKGYLNAITGAAAGAVGFPVQSVTTGKALAEATGNEAYQPSGARLGQEALVGAAIGGTVGAIRDVSLRALEARDARIAKARAQIQENIEKPVDTPAQELVDSPNLMADALVARPEADAAEGQPAVADADAVAPKKPHQNYHKLQFEEDRAYREMNINTLKDVKRYFNDKNASFSDPDPKIAQEFLDDIFRRRARVMSEEFQTQLNEARVAYKREFPNARLRSPEEDHPAGLRPIPSEWRKNNEAPAPAKPKTEYDADAVAASNYDAKLVGGEGQPEPTKVFTPSREGYAPIPLILEQVRALGAKPEMADLVKEWGFVQTPYPKQQMLEGKQQKLVLMRQIFKDQEQAESTLAHEFGHVIDSYSKTKEAQALVRQRPDAKEPVPVKLLRFNRELLKQYDNAEFLADATNLSKAWRPNWDVNPKYRSKPTEIQADIISAMFKNPEWVREQFPLVYEAVQAGFDTDPVLRKFWDDVESMKADPSKHMAWFEQKREASRIKDAEIYAKAESKRLEKKAEKQKNLPGQALEDTTARLVNQFHSVRKILGDLVSKGFSKEAVYGLYNKLYNAKNGYKTVEALLNTPLENFYKEYKNLGIETPGGKDPMARLKDYLHLERTLNDTNPLIESIKEDAPRFRQAVQDIRDLFGMIPEEKFNRDINVDGMTGWPLVQQLAKLHHEFLDPKLRAKIRNRLVQLEKFDAAALLEDNAFNVRSLIGNPDATRREAESHMAVLKSELGPDKAQDLENAAKKYHSIFSVVQNTLDEAGLLSPEMRKRFEINKDNYITTRVLKYFEEDPHVSATLKSQYGTLDEVGDELAATEMKMKALMTRGELQKAMNAAVEIARLQGRDVKPVDPEYRIGVRKGKPTPYAKSVYEQKVELQKKNPDKSYLVEYEEGKPTLYEIDSPDYGRMFDGTKLDKVPVISYALRTLEAFNRLTLARELKTIFSAPFVFGSKFYDTAQEALFARSKEVPGLPIHSSKELRAIKREAKDIAMQAYGGIVDPQLKEAIENNAIPYIGAEAFNGHDSAQEAFVSGVYKSMGVDVPGEESIDRSLSVSRKVNDFMEKVPFLGTVKRMAVTDELATKMAGYLIAKRVRGMGPQEAALAAREYFGTPDPSGGGIEAANINKVFLFGRAHINGMRAVANQFKEDPKGFASQYVYRKLIPRLLVTSGIAGPLVGAFFGEDAEKVTRKATDKISEFDRISKFNIPYGWVDKDNNFRWLYDVNPDEITHDWKVATIRAPMSRDLVAMDQLATPFIKFMEELVDEGTISAKHIGQSVKESLSSVAGGSFTPPVQWAGQITDLLTGSNPQDYYRNKNILSRDVQEAGGLLTKLYQYLGYTLFTQYPSMFNYKFKEESTEPTSVLEWATRIPQLGPTIGRFIGVSNYGEYEKYNELQQEKVERDAEIRLSMGPNARKLLNEYRKTQAFVSKVGKEWKQEASPTYVNRVHLLNGWHSKVYNDAFNELRAAYENGDNEEIASKSEQLENLSEYYLNALE